MIYVKLVKMAQTARKPTEKKAKLAAALKRNMARRKQVQAGEISPRTSYREVDQALRSAPREPLAAGVSGESREGGASLPSRKTSA